MRRRLLRGKCNTYVHMSAIKRFQFGSSFIHLPSALCAAKAGMAYSNQYLESMYLVGIGRFSRIYNYAAYIFNILKPYIYCTSLLKSSTIVELTCIVDTTFGLCSFACDICTF